MWLFLFDYSFLFRVETVVFYQLDNTVISTFYTIVCDKPLHIEMHQEAPAKRPGGEANLSCVLSGAHIKDVERYRWSVVETLIPLFDYKVRPN